MTQERTRQLAAVWFADIVDYSKLSSRDEDAAIAVVEELQRLAREQVESRGGRIVKFVGDAVLPVFDSTDAALDAALALQESFSASEIVQQKGCALRIGVHMGEVVMAKDGDVYGDGVNIASRIEGVASAGQVVVSEDVYRQVRSRTAYALRKLGERSLKGVEGSVLVYLIQRRGALTADDPPMSDLVNRLNAALDGRYAIEREIGEGGMATVYLAADIKHERKVALKILKPEIAAVVGAERFLAEIKTTADLQHLHIVPLYDSGEADGFAYYVMPYIEGESLRNRLKREEQFPVDEAVAVAADVAEALHVAHGQGVVHRDIKPGNILLSRGRPLVADFGIALTLNAGEEERLTGTGVSFGTPSYMSPEQASGDYEVDARSDVYSLACVLYALLAGEPPHTGSTVQVILAKKLTQAPAPLKSVRPDVPDHIDRAVARAL